MPPTRTRDECRDEGARHIAARSAEYGDGWVERFGARALRIVRAVHARRGGDAPQGAPPLDALRVRVYVPAERAFAERSVAELVAALAADGAEGLAAHHRPTRLQQIRVAEGQYLAWPIYRLLRVAWQAEAAAPAAAPAATGERAGAPA